MIFSTLDIVVGLQIQVVSSSITNVQYNTITVTGHTAGAITSGRSTVNQTQPVAGIYTDGSAHIVDNNRVSVNIHNFIVCVYHIFSKIFFDKNYILSVTGNTVAGTVVPYIVAGIYAKCTRGSSCPYLYASTINNVQGGTQATVAGICI